MSTMIIEGKIPHLIDDQKLKLGKPPDLLFELTLTVRLGKILDQGRSVGKMDPEPGLRSSNSYSDG